MKNETQIRKVANEAAKILKDYPHLKYNEAIMRAKEVLKDDKSNLEGYRKENHDRGC